MDGQLREPGVRQYSLPEILSAEALDELGKDRKRWVPTVRAIAEDHGLVAEHIELLAGSSLVVGIGRDHVIKLIPAMWRREYHAEIAGLTEVAGALPIATPAVIAAGSFPAWDYIVMTRLPGQPLGSQLERLPKSDVVEIVHTVGATLAALHALSPPVAGTLSTESWGEFVSAQSALCRKRQIGWGLHKHLAEGIPDCLERANLAVSDLAILHADLTSWNVMVANQGSRWKATGLIDFADARIGAPVYDMSPPALLIARMDRDLFHTLLDGYGMAPGARNRNLQDRLMAAAILHPFGDLTRNYDARRPPRSLIELQEAMFPL